jgi:hypothetical protein
MHPATHAAPTHAAATHATSHAATAVKGECRRRKGKRGAECARDEAIKEFVVHPNSSVVELQRRIASQQEDGQQTQKIQRFQMTNATVSDT